MEELTNKFANDIGKELKEFGSKDQVTITIPKIVTKLLMEILKVILYSIGILFTIILVLAGTNGNIGPTRTLGAVAISGALTSNGNKNNSVTEWNQGGYNKTRRNTHNTRNTHN